MGTSSTSQLTSFLATFLKIAEKWQKMGTSLNEINIAVQPVEVHVQK